MARYTSNCSELRWSTTLGFDRVRRHLDVALADKEGLVQFAIQRVRV